MVTEPVYRFQPEKTKNKKVKNVSDTKCGTGTVCVFSLVVLTFFLVAGCRSHTGIGGGIGRTLIRQATDALQQ